MGCYYFWQANLLNMLSLVYFFNLFLLYLITPGSAVVHGITPIRSRYPCKVVSLCQQTPFILSPVNGGLPFPPGFQETARQGFAQFNFLRAVGRALIPGYVETYKKADKVLAGSTYTLNLLKKLFPIPDRRIKLFYENGISQDFLMSAKPAK